MQDFFDKIQKAKIGAIIPVIKVLENPADPLEFFAKISNYGRKKDSLLFESADFNQKESELSIGTALPCLKMTGFKENFEITALNNLGRQFLKFIKKDLDFCDSVKYSKDKIIGKLTPQRREVSEVQRLKLKNHSDIIREIAFKFKPLAYSQMPYAGLLGSINFDFIDQYEDMPQKETEYPSYELYFVDNMFIVDHKENKTYIIANALVMDKKREETYKQCMSVIKSYEKALSSKIPKVKKPKLKKQEIETDTQKKDYEFLINKIKSQITQGYISQIHLSRTITTNYNSEPLDIYAELKKIEPSPYMFFINNKKGTLIGSSHQMFLRIKGENEKIVEMKPVSAKKPRGIINNNLDKEIDSRYEAELKLDNKALSQHAMLLDVARNDMAKISKPSTRTVENSFIIEKLPAYQRFVSNLKGILKQELDALYAYTAIMNPSSLSGIPKIEAIKILRENETSKRDFYGGVVCYLTTTGDFNSSVITTSMLLNNKAKIKTGTDIVYDSISKNKFDETENNVKPYLDAINQAGGLK